MKYKGSEKSKDMDNTQETLIKGSSETIRAAYDILFLDWFIGFSEGNGLFIVNNDGSLEFTIKQSSKDAAILFYIKKQLGFGSVSVRSKVLNIHYFKVRDKVGLFKIIFIFNGFLQLEKSKIMFKFFLLSYNNFYNTNIFLNLKNFDLISLNCAWLCGFTEAEGSFTVSIIEKNRKFPQVQVKFILSQIEEKDLLDRISILLNGKVSFNNGYNVVVQFSYLKNVLIYFKKFQLKTFKYVSFLNWRKIYNIIKLNKHCESLEILENIKKLAKNINVH